MKKLPKKSLGQNFLRDPKILAKIANAAEIESADTILEIGPGEGTLTSILLEKALKVIAVEKDEELALKLEERFKEEISNGKLEVITQDILKYEPEIGNYKLVGNIPYYITGSLFQKFLEIQNQPKSITFVVQKEVADRITARDGKESILSISIKAYGTPQYGGVIKAGSFYPAPKVDSAIISVINITKNKFVDINERKFFDLVKKGFAHKRKRLAKNLEIEDQILENLKISKDIRAEDLKLEDWFAILSLCLQKK